MATMSNVEPGDGHRHQGHLRGLADRIHEHHERAVHLREEEALAEAADQAGFDLETDIGHPTTHHPAAFDMDTDIGMERDTREPGDR
jgi:hypothetical protein